MRKLDVFLEIQGSEVYAGHIQGDDKTDAVFTYDTDYTDKYPGISVALPLSKEPFSPIETSSFFEGLLPEGFSRKSVAKWLHADEEDYLTILAGLGKECLGAIRVEESSDKEIEEPNYVPLTPEQVRDLASEGATKSTELLVKSHLSLTGASGKVGLYFKDGQWFQPIGTAPSTHIVKQSHVRLQHIVENEQLALRTAAHMGIPTIESFIVNQGGFNDSEILLASKRYDRDMENSVKLVSGMSCPLRLHQEDFAQALGIPGSKKYESPGDEYLKRIFRLVREQSKNPLRDQILLLDILIYDVLIGNTDNHIKNLSMLYTPDLSSMSLAPAYDLVSTMVYKESTAEMSIAIAGEIRWEKMNKETFLEASQDIGISGKVIEREYDRLAKGFKDSLEKSVAELKKEGFLHVDEISGKMMELCREKM